MNQNTFAPSSSVIESPALTAQGCPIAIETQSHIVLIPSNRQLKAACSQLLNSGTLPKGFAKLVATGNNANAKTALADARKARAETFANLPEARRIALAQVAREAMSAKRFSFADSGKGAARLSYR